MILQGELFKYLRKHNTVNNEESRIIFVCGPSKAGRSSVIRSIVDDLSDHMVIDMDNLECRFQAIIEVLDIDYEYCKMLAQQQVDEFVDILCSIGIDAKNTHNIIIDIHGRDHNWIQRFIRLQRAKFKSIVEFILLDVSRDVNHSLDSSLNLTSTESLSNVSFRGLVELYC